MPTSKSASKTRALAVSARSSSPSSRLHSASFNRQASHLPLSRKHSPSHPIRPSLQSQTSASSSPAVTPRPRSPAKSFSSPLSPPQQEQREEAAGAAAAHVVTALASQAVMSPLARALQAQWCQLQQDMWRPSVLPLDRRQRTTTEEDVLRVLGSITSCAEMSVEDAAHTVPYLLAFAVAPLPSLKTQVVALAALRGVLSSLPGVYGTEAASKFVEDIFLGEHQALSALSLCALTAVESYNAEEDAKGASPLSSTSSPSSLKPRGGQRSLLSREDPTGGQAVRMENGEFRSAHTRPQSVSFSRSASPSQAASNKEGSSAYRTEEMRRRVAGVSLHLLNDAATLCGAVADALLSSDALLKAALRLLACSAAVVPQTGSMPVAKQSLTCPSNAIDVIRVLLTLLTSEPVRHNEAALVLCSYDAPRAVCTLAQSLAYLSYDARGVVGEASAADDGEREGAETLLWNSLKVMGWLTRGCPSGMKHYLSENKAIPSFLFLALTVPVAEIREAAALWLAALLETQAHASLQFVNDLLDFTPSTTTPTASGVSVMGALVEMLRWRGAQMHVYGVSAIVCWRWMLLSHPSRIAAVLQRDSSLLATLLELILRASPVFSTSFEAAVSATSDVSAHGTGRRAREKDTAPHRMHNASNADDSTSLTLPLRLIALEAVHVLALSWALGSLETRVRLEAQLVGGAISPTTLLRLRDTAECIIKRTHPAYYDDFPAMEVKLAEPELSEAMLRAGATVSPPSVSLRNAEAEVAPASSPRSNTSVTVRITAGGQWHQLIVESLADLTTGEPAPSNALLAATHPLSLTGSSSSLRSSSRQLLSHRHRQQLRPQPRRRSASLGSQRSADVHASVLAAASDTAPIRVLGSVVSSPSHRSAAPRNTSNLERRSGVAEGQEEGEEAEHRVDINSIISASLADTQSKATAPAGAGTRMPRTVREATLLPTSQSTTVHRFRVVQQAEGLGGLFMQDSMCTILQLAQHYMSSKTSAGAGRPVHASLVRGSVNVSHLDASSVDPSVRLRGTSPSAVFGSAPRFGRAPRKEPNPFAPVVKTTSGDRLWKVQELRREDVLLFLIRYTHLMAELPEAIEAVEDHLYFLRRQLQLCPTRDMGRRCVLNDLYMNVYPSVHLFLRFINQQARRSRGVLQLLSSLNGGTIHSGNLPEVYDAVGQCTGLSTSD
ncbi:hypothetical protein ABL78_2539 [Leptomonas seymouri]|uniref:Uncharacterized protein n=1 Tax=Leptomonas seymouri TaxID=5684 RepID=A0A0N1PED4_LEPSE|nr:hypothetical protein ABL78_2539 [Leptomonas seymouri]|eukprot:KPI88364.1 hypothetical protein ABL78_2539 [Leptomonas seymouri]